MWCVTNGFAIAPPGIGWNTGVSTSMNPRSSSHRRVSESTRDAHRERALRVLGDPEVDVTLPIPRVDVGQAVPLVGEGAARFGEQHPFPHLHRDLALAGLHHFARDAQPVAEVQVAELLEAGSRVGGGEQLHPAARVGERGERELSLHPPQQDAAGDAHRDRALLTGLEVGEVPLDRGRVPRSLVAKRGLFGHQINLVNLDRANSAAISEREPSASLVNTCETCVFTVAREIVSADAISGFVLPSATRATTSSSVG